MKSVLISILIASSLLSCTSSRKLASEHLCSIKFKRTKQNLDLINKRWSETSIKVLMRQNDHTELDITDQFMLSDIDDLMIFHENGTFVFDEGASKATPGSHQVYGSGSWALYEKESKLVLCTDDYQTVYEVVVLNPNELILHLKESDSRKSYTYVLTYHPV